MAKLLVKFGDKALAAVVLLYVLTLIFGAVQRWTSEPEVSAKITQSVALAKSSQPAPRVELEDYQYVSLLEEALEWPEIDAVSRRPIRYRHEEIDTSVLQDQYVSLLKQHDHLMVLMPSGEGKKHCAFPGCGEQELPPPVYIGAPEDLEVTEVGVMTVGLSWSAPSDFKDVTLTHCIVERGLVENGEVKKWTLMVDEEGGAKEIIGKEKLGGEDDLSDRKDASGFVLPSEMEKGPEEADQKTSPLRFFLLDFNLNPKTTYAYRVKAIGVSLRDGGEVIEGQRWTPQVMATTKEDQGVGFIRYIPGLRGEDGDYLMRDGAIVSPDKVYVRIRKLFSPPWSDQRYFVEYEHRNIVPGEEGENEIGKVVRNFSVLTDKGHPVYIDRKNENFLYAGAEMSEDEVKRKRQDGDWRAYKVIHDFSTDWVAKEVKEEVVEEKSITTKYDKRGDATTETTQDKKYRYFLILENKKTKEAGRLELERDQEDLTKRILQY